MNTQSSNPTDFETIYKTILNNCERLTPGYEQLTYLRMIIAECNKFSDYEFLVKNDILEKDELRKVMPELTKRFYILLQGPHLASRSNIKVSETLLLYHKEKNKDDLSAFFENAERLINELNIDTRNKEKEIKMMSLRNEDVEKVNRIKVLSGLSDVVRICEAMKKAGIISTKTEVKQIAQMFHTEVAESYSFEKKYNATKNRLDKEKSSSNSKPLVYFVKILCEEAFRNKEKEIEEIIDHLEGLQKNII